MIIVKALSCHYNRKKPLAILDALHGRIDFSFYDLSKNHLAVFHDYNFPWLTVLLSLLFIQPKPTGDPGRTRL